MNTNSSGFLYQPSALEEAYGIYLLQSVFQINVNGGMFCNNARISGREAVPFLSKSGVDRQILRNVWTVADPQTVGSLTSPQQFYTLLRLTALAQAEILGQALQVNAFMSPVQVLQQCLHQTCQQQLPLAVFEGISIPNQESLFQMMSSGSMQMQQQLPSGQSMSDPFGSLSSRSTSSFGSGFGTSAPNNTTNASSTGSVPTQQQQQQAHQQSPSMQQQQQQQQQQQTSNCHVNLSVGGTPFFGVVAPAAAAAAPTSIPPPAPKSAPVQLSSIEDAFGGLVEVEDAPLPSLDQYVAAPTTTTATEARKTEEPVHHGGDDEDFGDFASISEPMAAQTSADPTATIGSAATTGTQSSLLSDVFGDMSQQQHPTPPIPSSQSLVDPTSTVGSVVSTVTQGSLLKDVHGDSGGSQQQQQQQQQQTPGLVAQTQQPAQLVSEDENDDDDYDFGDFAGTTAATSDDSWKEMAPAGATEAPQLANDSGPSGWDALDALAAVQDAPLPTLSSFGEPATAEPSEQVYLESIQRQQQVEQTTLQVENVKEDEDETDFGDFEGIVEEVIPAPVAQTTGDGFARSFSNPPTGGGEIKDDTTFKETESTSQEFRAHTQSTESASNGFAGSFEGPSTGNVQVKDEVIPEVAKAASRDFGLFGEAPAASSANATSQQLSVDGLQGMLSTDSQQPGLSGWDALDALGGIQDAPLKSLETLGSNDEPLEELAGDAAGNNLQARSEDQLDKQKDSQQVDMFGSSADEATPGITTAVNGDDDFGEFQDNTSTSNKDTVFRPHVESGDSTAQSNEVVSDPADTSNPIENPKRQTAERIDSAYYSAQGSMSEEFEDALQVQPDESNGDQQMLSEAVEAPGLEQTPTLATSSFGFPSNGFKAAASDDPFSVFDSLAPPQPTVQPLSSFGQEDAENEAVDQQEDETGTTLDKNNDVFGVFSAADARTPEHADQSTMVAPSSSGDGFEGFSGSAGGPATSHNDAAPDNKDGDLISGFSAQLAPESRGLDVTSNVCAKVQSANDDSFGDFGGFASAQESAPTPVDTGRLETSVEAKAAISDAFGGFGDFSGPKDALGSTPPVEDRTQPADNEDESFGDFSTPQEQLVGSASQGNTVEGATLSVDQITQQPQSSDKEDFGGLGDFGATEQQTQEVDLFASSDAEPRSQAESPEDESFGDFGDFNAVQDQIEEGNPKEGVVFASSNVEASAQASPKDEGFGDFGDFNAAAALGGTPVDTQKEKDLFVSSTVEVRPQPQSHEDESFGDFGDFSAANEEAAEMPASTKSFTDVKHDDQDASFGAFASFDESEPKPLTPDEPDPETKNLIALRDFICSSSLQLPEGIRRQGGDGGGRVNFSDAFDANIGMEVPVSDERKKRIQRSIQVMTVLSTSQTKLASTYWGQTFKISCDELSVACNLMEEAANMATEEKGLVRKKLETYFCGLGEFVRVCRSIAATIGDLFMLDPSALLTVDTLNSSWCSVVLLEDYLAVEQLWKKLKSLAETVGITQGQESEYRLESLTEVRAQAAQDSDRPLCCFTLQPLSLEPTLPTKTPLNWNNRPFMACAANFLANRIVSYATSTSFSEQEAR